MQQEGRGGGRGGAAKSHAQAEGCARAFSCRRAAVNFLALAASRSSMVCGSLLAAAARLTAARGTALAAEEAAAAPLLAAAVAAAVAAAAGAAAGAKPSGGSHCVAPVPALW